MSKVSREKEQPLLSIYPLSMKPSYHRKKRSTTGFDPTLNKRTTGYASLALLSGVIKA
jgi:hypothetical protein